MSKIQEHFSGSGRRLFDSEKPVVDAFNHKYGHASTGSAVSQRHSDRPSSPGGEKARPFDGRLSTDHTHRGEQRRLLAASWGTQMPSGAQARVVAEFLGNEKDSRGSQSVSAKARMMKRQSVATIVTKKLNSPKGK